MPPRNANEMAIIGEIIFRVHKRHLLDIIFD